MIDRQTTALTLLITSSNLPTHREQQKLLNNSFTRQLLRHVVKDSDSLRAQYDNASVHTEYVDNLSRASAEFQFDSILMHSSPYERVLNFSLTDTFRRSILGRVRPPKAAPVESMTSSIAGRPTRSQSEGNISAGSAFGASGFQTPSTLVDDVARANTQPSSVREGQRSLPYIPPSRRSSSTPAWPLMGLTWDSTKAFTR
ncbi:hypothetical protein TruAng_004003 [Truncatella angustata]|nr:hypothetical protein TruAng_004003 [Truncatella angustata]